MSADVVVVLEQGRVVEQGTHAELLAARSHYYRLWEYQFPLLAEGRIPVPALVGAEAEAGTEAALA